MGRRASYAYIEIWKGGLGIVFHSRTKKLCLDEFRTRVQEIRHDTWPQNRDPLDDPSTSIQFKVNPREWEEHRESLTTLVQTVYAAWQDERQVDGADSMQ